MVADPRARLNRYRPGQLTLPGSGWGPIGLGRSLPQQPLPRASGQPGVGQLLLEQSLPGRARPGPSRPDRSRAVPSGPQRQQASGAASAGQAPSGRAPFGPAPFGPAPSRSALDLLGQARAGLAEAAELVPAGERYAGAHLAALRATAAVLAARAHPQTATRRRRLRSAWELLCEVAPEMGEWAAFFAAGATKRAAAEAGVARAVSAREADDLVRDVETFLAVVATTVGVAAD